MVKNDTDAIQLHAFASYNRLICILLLPFCHSNTPTPRHGEGQPLSISTHVWDQEVKTLLISSTLFGRPVKSHYLPWHPKAELWSAEKYVEINQMVFKPDGVTSLWHRERNLILEICLCFVMNYFQKSNKSTFMGCTLCLGRKLYVLKNRISKGCSETVCVFLSSTFILGKKKTTKKLWQQFILSLLNYRALKHTLYQHQVKNVFYYNWKEKSNHWRHTVNSSKATNALRSLNKLL